MSRERPLLVRMTLMGLLCLQLVFSGLLGGTLATNVEAASPSFNQREASVVSQSNLLVHPHTVVTNCTDAGLQAAITAGGSISFNCPSPYTINLTSQKGILGTVSIDGSNNGNQMTIDGGNTYRVFAIAAIGNLTLTNLKIAHGFVPFGNNSFGGGIYNAGTLSLTNVFLVSNQAYDSGGGLYNAAGATASLNQAYFSFNQASTGGGIDNEGTLTSIIGGSFNNNGSVDGGAIYLAQGQTTISHVSFDSNFSSGRGGAVEIDHSGTAVIITNSTSFTNNQAAFQGGAIWNGVSNPSVLRIDNTTFTGNKVTGQDSVEGGDSWGGAIYTYRTGDMNISNSSFTSNSVKGGNGSSGKGGIAYGGAIAMERTGATGTLTITNTIFNLNTATGGNGTDYAGGQAFGGAVDAENSVLIASSNTFSSNSVLGGKGHNDVGGQAYGGAISKYISNIFVIKASTFASNTAQGGDNDGTTAGNAYGGAIYNISNNLPILVNSTLFGNKAIGGAGTISTPGGNALGGGIYSNGSLGSINNTISQNSAVAGASGLASGISKGGGIYSAIGTSFTTINSIISGSGSGKDCDGTIGDGGYNLESGDSSCGFSVANHDQTGDPKLGPLANNDGPTQTLALQSGSAAIDNGSDTVCANYTNNVDQRGFVRPAGAHCDIGAYELAYSNPGSYTYNLPLLANGANTAVGQTTTFVTFQNLSGSSPATVTVQYYGISNGNPGPSDSLTIAPKGQKAILPNIPAGASFGGVVTSNQPLNLVVSESLNSGGSAYNVAASTASTLYTPLALNGQYNFTTSIVVFNAASTGTSTGTIQFFDEAGNPVPGATKTFSVAAHASQIFNQAANGSGLAANHAYWAKISATSGSDSLTAQVIEFGPANFVATFNAILPSQLQSTLYAPATFNGQFNFVTGLALANPNDAAASVTINYYDANGLKVFVQSNLPVAANGVIGVFQPGVNGLPNTVSSATIISNQPLIMAVNERGPGSISGTYVGLANGNTKVALPVMAKGFAGFVTGSTVLNTGSSPATLTFTYIDQSGAQVGNPQTKTLAPNASFLVFQGGADQGLPDGFFGTALISSNQPLLVTTNALNTNSGLFYTYTEPSN